MKSNSASATMLLPTPGTPEAPPQEEALGSTPLIWQRSGSDEGPLLTSSTSLNPYNQQRYSSWRFPSFDTPFFTEMWQLSIKQLAYPSVLPRAIMTALAVLDACTYSRRYLSWLNFNWSVELILNQSVASDQRLEFRSTWSISRPEHGPVTGP